MAGEARMKGWRDRGREAGMCYIQKMRSIHRRQWVGDNHLFINKQATVNIAGYSDYSRLQ